MIKIADAVLNLIYPPRCAVCLDIIPMGGNKYLCGPCFESMNKNNGITVKYFNDKSIKFTENITSAFAVYSYGEVREAVRYFKFDGYKRSGAAFAEIMHEVAQRNFPYIFKDCDLLVPVPIHSKRYKERGFNQSEIMAERLAELTGIKTAADTIIRTKETAPQSSLNASERRKNIKGAFEFGNGDVKGMNILLIDDIFTTGATLNECASVLLKNGAKEVNCYTFAAAILD